MYGKQEGERWDKQRVVGAWVRAVGWGWIVSAYKIDVAGVLERCTLCGYEG